ncbi:MAG: tetratricopeptide repeat protein [Longimicrobiales bacterium]
MADMLTLKQRRRGSRTAPFFLLAPLVVTLAGCVATKGDVRTLQDELADLRTRQDSLVRAAARQNRVLADSLQANTELLRTMRGQLVNQISQVQELLLTVQQLLGQNEQRLAQMRDQMEQQRQAAAQPPPSTPGRATGQSNFDEMVAAGMSVVKSSPASARAAFQRILSEHPQHERLPMVQFYIAETYYEEGNFEQAYREFDLVAESWPNHERARAALYRAGVIAEERKNTQKAREYYTKVSTNYRDTDEARQATQALRRLPRQ